MRDHFQLLDIYADLHFIDMASNLQFCHRIGLVAPEVDDQELMVTDVLTDTIDKIPMQVDKKDISWLILSISRGAQIFSKTDVNLKRSTVHEELMMFLWFLIQSWGELLLQPKGMESNHILYEMQSAILINFVWMSNID